MVAVVEAAVGGRGGACLISVPSLSTPMLTTATATAMVQAQHPVATELATRMTVTRTFQASPAVTAALALAAA